MKAETMNSMNEQAATSPSSITSMSTVYTTPEAIKQAQAASLTGRLITITQRNPSRIAAVRVPADAWDQVSTSLQGTAATSAYIPLLHAVLDTAAKAILTRRIGEMSVFPTSIDVSIFSADAILSEAASGNTDWLSKEELTQAWEQSHTRAKFHANPAYTTNKAYRAAVAKYAELIIKLAGKTSAYTPNELDSLLVKLHPADHATEFGSFVLRRIQALQNKPAREELDLDLL